MTFLDRLLLLTAVLSGVLVSRGPALANPVKITCVDTCQQTQQYYDCVKNHAYEYELDDCFHCAATGSGACQIRANMPGGTCTKRELPRKWRYVKDYTKVCKCEGWVTRIEIEKGVKFTEWDMMDGDLYYTCEPPKK
jgi:hypothetical protein